MPYTEKTYSHLAMTLRDWRRKYGLTLQELSAITDISPRTLEGIEQGRGFRYPNLLSHALRGITALGGEMAEGKARLNHIEDWDHDQPVRKRRKNALPVGERPKGQGHPGDGAGAAADGAQDRRVRRGRPADGAAAGTRRRDFSGEK